MLNIIKSIERERRGRNGENAILYNERYNDGQQNTFVKSPGNSRILLVKNDKNKDVVGSWFREIFLPRGYPQSVSMDYENYQLWDTVQAFCSTFIGVAATQEVFRGLGVGDTNATFYGATVTWILKTVTGQLGGIAFAYTYGTYLDAYSKKWRLIADILNDFALCLELALPLYVTLTPLVLCVSNTLKAVVGIAGGATKSAMINHHAIRENAADVSAKDAVQETTVNLISSITAIFLLPFLDFPLPIFLFMISMHIYANYLAVRSLSLNIFNETRYLQVIDMFLKQKWILDPFSVNMDEPLNLWEWGAPMLNKKVCGFQILIGKSISAAHHKCNDLRNWMIIKKVYKNKNYILYPDTEEKIVYLYIKDNITSEELLCGYFHAVLLGFVITAMYKKVIPAFPNVTLKSFFATMNPESRKYVEWDHLISVILHVNDMVDIDWDIFCTGLKEKGWNLKKNLLIVDEWRVTST